MLCLYRSTTQTVLLFIQEAIDCHALILYGFFFPSSWRETLLARSAVLRVQGLNHFRRIKLYMQVHGYLQGILVRYPGSFWQLHSGCSEVTGIDRRSLPSPRQNT